jgi:hypothetical protein
MCKDCTTPTTIERSGPPTVNLPRLGRCDPVIRFLACIGARHDGQNASSISDYLDTFVLPSRWDVAPANRRGNYWPLRRGVQTNGWSVIVGPGGLAFVSIKLFFTSQGLVSSASLLPCAERYVLPENVTPLVFTDAAQRSRLMSEVAARYPNWRTLQPAA